MFLFFRYYCKRFLKADYLIKGGLHMKKKILSIASICLLLGALLIFTGCSRGAGADENTTVIGASLPTFDDKWMTYLIDGMKEHEEGLEGVEVRYTDALNDPSKQLAQVENFISQKVDAIFIVPVESESMDIITQKANDAEIPVVVVNRIFDQVDQATAFVGSESVQAGIIQMEEVAKRLDGKGNIAILKGRLGHEAQIKRTEGNLQVIEKYPDMQVVMESAADWDRAKGLQTMENWLKSGKQIDAVVANNDEMAIGAIKAIKEAGMLDEIIVAGVDATPDALEFVKNGEMSVTVYQDAVGQGIGGLDAAAKIAKGEEVEHLTWIPFELVTSENVDEFIQKWE
jgi:inositol transport system substrate-binding protein